jgi:hypothetical protein
MCIKILLAVLASISLCHSNIAVAVEEWDDTMVMMIGGGVTRYEFPGIQALN